METFRVPSIRLTGRACNQPLTQYPGSSAARPKGKTDEMTRTSCLFGGKNRRRGRRREREMGREIRGMLEVFGERKPERPELEAEECRMGRLQNRVQRRAAASLCSLTRFLLSPLLSLRAPVRPVVSVCQLKNQCHHELKILELWPMRKFEAGSTSWCRLFYARPYVN